MRLQRPIFVNKPVSAITIRVITAEVPTSASVRITDIQLQAGEQATGVVPNPAEVGTTRGRPQYRNGIIRPGLKLVALSNADRAAPVRVEVRNAAGATRIGSYRFGPLNGRAVVDGPSGTATHGHGRAPIITERQDLHLNTELEGRAHLRLAWHERA